MGNVGVSARGEGVGNQPVRWHLAPVQLAAVIGVVVFAVEASEVFFYRLLPPVPEPLEPLLDALYMTVVLAPLLYLLFVRRMNNEIARRRQAEAELRDFNRRLETTVQERTEELLTSNRQLARLIDEQRSTTESLQRANRFVGNVFERAPCLILAFDASSYRCGYANCRVSDILGYEQDEFAASTQDVVKKLVAQGDQSHFLALLRNVGSGAGDEVGHGTCTLLAAGGKSVKVAFGVSVLERTGISQAKDFLLTAMPVMGC